jgi:hypothetical protein
MHSANGSPWYLRVWGETKPVLFIDVDLDNLPSKDVWRVDRLEGLFPEAKVTISRRGRDRDPREKFS